jgi:hypothetical protein
MNRRKFSGCSSQFKGVCWSRAKKKWTASVSFNRKTYRFGDFDTEEAAARAYDDGIVNLYGEFARFNFPERQDRTRAVLQERIIMLEGTVDALTNRD